MTDTHSYHSGQETWSNGIVHATTTCIRRVLTRTFLFFFACVPIRTSPTATLVKHASAAMPARTTAVKEKNKGDKRKRC